MPPRPARASAKPQPFNLCSYAEIFPDGFRRGGRTALEGTVALADLGQGTIAPVKSPYGAEQALPPRTAFAGFKFPSEVIVVAVRWYLRYGLSYRDVEELLAGRCCVNRSATSSGRISR